MKWYDTYLKIYNVEYQSIDISTKEEIKKLVNKINNVDNPVATLAVIAHNESNKIAANIWSLCNNKCKYSYEIIVIDNNSTDNTCKVLSELGVKWYEEKRKGPGFARNCGLDHAKGKYYLCIDSDSLYPPTYIETYIKTLMKKDIVCCYGLWSFLPDNRHSKLQLVIYEFLRDIYLRFQNIKRPELNVRGMVFAFNTELGRIIRFRTDIIRGEDGSLALAMKSFGKLRFITNLRTRIITDNNTMNADGSMIKSFMKRLKKAFYGIVANMHSKSKYVDEESNIIK